MSDNKIWIPDKLNKWIMAELVEILDDNRVNLTFEINESDVVTVSKITFIGNKVFSSRELRKVMKTKSSNLFRFFSSSERDFS